MQQSEGVGGGSGSFMGWAPIEEGSDDGNLVAMEQSSTDEDGDGDGGDQTTPVDGDQMKGVQDLGGNGDEDGEDDDGDGEGAPPTFDQDIAPHITPAFSIETWLFTDPATQNEWYPPIQDYDVRMINKDVVSGMMCIKPGALRDEDVIPLTAQLMAGETIIEEKQEAVLDGCPILWIPMSPWIPMLMDSRRRGVPIFGDSGTILTSLYTIEQVLRDNLLGGSSPGDSACQAIVDRLDHLSRVGQAHARWLDSTLTNTFDNVPAHKEFLTRWGAKGDWPREDPIVVDVAQRIAMLYLQIMWEYLMRKVHVLEMRCCVLRSVPPSEWVTLMTPVLGINATQFMIDGVLEMITAGEQAALRWPPERPRPTKLEHYKMMSEEDRRSLTMSQRPWKSLRTIFTQTIRTKDDNTKLAAYSIAARTIQSNGLIRKYQHALRTPLPERQVIELPRTTEYDQVRPPNMAHRLNAVIVVQMAYAMWSTPPDADMDASGIHELIQAEEDAVDAADASGGVWKP